MSTKRFISYPKNNNIYRGDITDLFENYTVIYFSKNDIIYYNSKYYIFLKNYTWTYSSWADNEREDFDDWIGNSLGYNTISRWYMLDPILSKIGTGSYAPINSPAFTGTPTVPTPASTSSSQQIANTSWVKSQITTVNNNISNATKIQSLYVYDSAGVKLEVGDTHDQAFSKLEKKIEDNEYVVAEAISDLDSRLSNIAPTMIKVTYDELKTLKSERNLIPGTWYRLTDYECTTTTTGTKSAGHKFDIIILALSENSLSEECRAMLNEDNIYDVSIKYGSNPSSIQQKCYIYQYDDLNYSIVDISTLKGIDVSISNVSIDENNKTASINHSILKLNLSNLSINYFNPWYTWAHNKFSKCNILSWKIWYTLDNIRWSNAHDAYTCYDVTATIMGESQRLTVHQYYNAWVSGYSYTDPDTNITYYCWSTGGDSVDFWTTTLDIASGSYTIYMGGYLPNPNYAVPADIIVHGTLNIPKGKGTIYRMIDDHNNDCPWDFKNILFSKEINGSSKWVYTFTANIATGEIIDGTIERNGPDDGQGFWIQVWPSENNTIKDFTYLPTDGIVLFNPDGGQYTEEESELHSYTSCSNNTIISGHNISISGSDNNLDDYCYDVSITGTGNKMGRLCHNIIFYGSDNNTLGSGCDYITLSNYNQYNIFGNDVHHVSFNSTFIQGAVVENGISWVNLSTSGTTSGANRLRGVTISTGFAGTEASPKNIVHPTLNDTFKTVYQPANSQVISI